MTVSHDVYPSLSIAISKIYKEGGIGAFYAGISPTLIGMLPYSTCYYFMYETLKKKYCNSKNKRSLNRPEMLALGALAGEIPGLVLLVHIITLFILTNCRVSFLFYLVPQVGSRCLGFLYCIVLIVLLKLWRLWTFLFISDIMDMR